MDASCMIAVPFSQISDQGGVAGFWSIPASRKILLRKDH
jgi:hypothetical protein